MGFLKNIFSGKSKQDSVALVPSKTNKIMPINYNGFMFRDDGWANVLTNLGVQGKDKKLSSKPVFQYYDRSTFETLYQGNAIAARIVDLPVAEMSREGFKISSDSLTQEDIGKFEKEMESLGVEEKFEEAYTLARIYGGSGILIGADDGLTWDQPLDLKRIRSIHFLAVLDRHELVYDSSIINKDPRSENFGYPNFFRIQDSRVKGSKITENFDANRIHWSRVIKFDGVKLGRRLERYFQYWGDSIFSRTYNSLLNYGITNSAIPNIIQDFTKLVVKMEELPQIISQGDDEALIARLNLLSMTSSVINAMILRKEEDVENKSANVSGLDGLAKLVYDALVADNDIPHTILFNESAGGLGSTGESERRSWYDYIRGLQNKIFRPRLIKIIDILRSAQDSSLAGKNFDYTIEFNKLYQMTEKEDIELRQAQAQVDGLYIEKGVLDAIEVRKSRFGSGTYSVETALEEGVTESLLETINNPQEDFPGQGDLLNLISPQDEESNQNNL